MRLISLVVVGVATASAVAGAGPNRHYYSAFDLADKLVVPVPDGARVGPELESRGCKSKIESGVLTIERTDAAGCKTLFASRQPQDLTIDFEVLPATLQRKPGAEAPAPVRIASPLLFDHGLRAVTRAEYDREDARIDFRDTRASGDIAYYSTKVQRWSTVKVTAGVATLPGEPLADGTAVFFRPALRTEVVSVTLYVARPRHVGPPPRLEETCKETLAALPPHTWESRIDAANPANALQVTTFPQIVEPSSFGVIVLRHAENLAPTFDSTGSVKLETPGIRDGTGQSGNNLMPTEADDAPPPGLACSVYQVAPRGAGAFTITVALQDPARSAKVSERKLDVIVLQRYAGAFRVGVAGIFLAPDRKFEARTATSSSQAEIVQTAQTPLELVLGYSLYFTRRGRSYFSMKGERDQDSHWGLFLGFGAASVTSGSIDFLKSLHAGIELEIGPYFAIAATGVLRRVDELAAGAQVGGPAGMTIPTQTTYAPGVALVLSITPSFFRFAKGIGG